MSGIVPATPGFPSSGTRAPMVCAIVQPRPMRRRADLYALCKALPSGVPDKLEVTIVRYEYGEERSTAAYYGGRAYLIHIAMTPRAT